ncbi:uncharacterized protein LOC141628839 [Silene latifolia]|uniref:uncharacterized protein LOC141628839 n=1 Tax=Silene latifolia TaxID=37657 RepID=UPI003D789E25
MTLVDDGSAVNVIPLKMVYKLGMKELDWTLSNQGVRAYDSTRHKVIGLINLTVATRPVERKVNFQIVDIEASFNLLLCRPWIHASKAMTSTLHQKIKIPLDGRVVTITSSPIKVVIEKISNNQFVSDPMHELGGFQIINLVERYDHFTKDCPFKRTLSTLEVIHWGEDEVLVYDNEEEPDAEASEEVQETEMVVMPDSELPRELLPLRGMERYFNLIPGAVLPNKAAYRNDLKATHDLHKKLGELMSTGFVRDSLSSCAVPALLVPKKQGWNMENVY